MTRIGLISDTHGKLDNRVFNVFDSVDLILHAGDIGHPDILTSLNVIAPVTAVYGNCDAWEIRRQTREWAELYYENHIIRIRHIPNKKFQAHSHPGPAIVIHGHIHRPALERRGKTWIINPGSATQPRNDDGRRTAGLLTLNKEDAEINIVALEDGRPIIHQKL
jgi:uncharacterized protein